MEKSEPKEVADQESRGGESVRETLEADVLEESGAKKRPKAPDEIGVADVAQTAEFDYIDDWDAESEISEISEAEESAPSVRVPEPPDTGSGPITRALDDFDAFLNHEDDEDLAGDGGVAPELLRSEANASGSNFERREPSGAFGFDQPQVSGVFSRYDEETRESDSDEFDLFEDDAGEPASERTLQDIVNGHEKQVRRLKKQLAYQKEVIQVVSELLVEARVISKRELKKRLRALRNRQ